LNVRLTDEEMESVRAASAIRGARCISEFIRAVLLEHLRSADGNSGFLEVPDNSGEAVGRRLAAMEERISLVESRLAWLLQHLARIGTQPHPKGVD